MEQVINKILFDDFKKLLLLIKNNDFIHSPIYQKKNSRNLIKIKLPFNEDYKELYLYQSSGINSKRPEIFLPFFNINIFEIIKVSKDTAIYYENVRSSVNKDMTYFIELRKEYNLPETNIKTIPGPRYMFHPMFLIISYLLANTIESFTDEDIEDITNIVNEASISLDELNLFKVNLSDLQIEEISYDFYEIVNEINKILIPEKIESYYKKYLKYKMKYLQLKKNNI